MLARALPYARRLELASAGARAHASLAGIALALRALAQLGVRAAPESLHFPQGGKPVLRGPGAEQVDFSISHADGRVACAALRGARIGLDIECATARGAHDWVLREAALKCLGHPLARAPALQRQGERICVGGTWLHTRRVDIAPGLEAALAATVPVPTPAPRDVPLAQLLDGSACAA